MNIARFDLHQFTVTTFGQALVKENAKRETPIPHCISKAGGAFHLGYVSQKDRDLAVQKGLAIDGIMVTLELPIPPWTTYWQTI